jgi:hypothetical protein
MEMNLFCIKTDIEQIRLLSKIIWIFRAQKYFQNYVKIPDIPIPLWSNL